MKVNSIICVEYPKLSVPDVLTDKFISLFVPLIKKLSFDNEWSVHATVCDSPSAALSKPPCPPLTPSRVKKKAV